MKLKISIYIILILIIAFLLKSRIVSKENFDLMVLMETNEILETCNNKIKAQANGKLFKIPDNHKFYFIKYGDSICNNSFELRKKVEDETLTSLRSNWLFVL